MKRRKALPLLALAATLLFACSVGPPQRPSPSPCRSNSTSTGQTTDPTGQGCTTSAGDYRRWWHEWSYRADVSNLAVWVDQVPPVGFDSQAIRHSGSSIPSGARVVVLRRGDEGLRRLSRWSSCRGAIAEDGTICPGMVLPGVELDAGRVARLQALVEVAWDETRPQRTCWDDSLVDFHLVALDPAGAPVWTVALDLQCNRWLFPDTEVSRPMPHAVRPRIRALLHELGFWTAAEDGTWPCGFEEAYQQWYRGSHETPVGGSGRPARLRSTRAPLPVKTRQSDLNSTQRRQLCAWNVMHLSPLFSSDDYPCGWERAVEGTDWAGWSRAMDWETCVRHFPSCPVTLEEILPCMAAAQQGDPWMKEANHKPCVALKPCLWGFVSTVEHSPKSRPRHSELRQPCDSG